MARKPQTIVFTSQIKNHRVLWLTRAVNAIHFICPSASTQSVTGSVSSKVEAIGTLRAIQLCPQDYWIVNYKMCESVTRFIFPMNVALLNGTAVAKTFIKLRPPIYKIGCYIVP